MPLGLFFLWVLSLIVTVGAWFCSRAALASIKKVQSRKQITGCELARQALDRHHLNQTPISSIPREGAIHFGLESHRLVLPEEVYYGTGLFEHAIVLHEVSHLQAANHMVFSSKIRRRARALGQGFILVSWFFIFLGFISPSRAWLAGLGGLFFVAVSLRALMLLAEEWDVTDRALSDMVGLEGLGTDERVYLKRLLQVFRWAPLAEVISAPFSLLLSFFRKGKAARVSQS